MGVLGFELRVSSWDIPQPQLETQNSKPETQFFFERMAFVCLRAGSAASRWYSSDPAG
jgi:hypothetical protein